MRFPGIIIRNFEVLTTFCTFLCLPTTVTCTLKTASSVCIFVFFLRTQTEKRVDRKKTTTLDSQKTIKKTKTTVVQVTGIAILITAC